MLVTDAGRLIRVPARPGAHHRPPGDGRDAVPGDAGEHVTSVFPVIEAASDENGAPETTPEDD